MLIRVIRASLIAIAGALGCVTLGASGSAAQEVRGPADQRPRLPDFAASPAESSAILPRIELPGHPGTEAMWSGVRFAVRGYRIEGVTVLDDDVLDGLTAPYTDREVGWPELESLRDEITETYIARGYVSSGAVIPDQTIENGIVVIRVVEGELGEAVITTDGRYRTAVLERRVLGGLDGPVDVNALEERLQFLQQDERIRSVDARLLPSAERGLARLELDVHEMRPWWLQVDVDNHAVPAVGSWQAHWEAAFTNVAGFGDTVSGFYDIADGLHQIEARYAFPISETGTTVSLLARRSWSEVVESPFDELDIQSRSSTYGVEVRQSLYTTLSTRFDLFVAGEVRRSKSLLLGSPFSFSEGPEDGLSKLTVARIGQEWSRRARNQVVVVRSVLSFGLDALGSTVHGRNIPDGEFVSLLAQLQVARRLEFLDALIVLRVDAQQSNGPLLGLEQIAVGGASSVRGYRENTLVRDSGYIGSIEARFPVSRRGDGSTLLELGAFIDAGYATNRERPTTGPRALLGVGLSARLQIDPNTRLELAWAESLKDVPFSQDHDLQDSGIYLKLSWRFQ